MKMLWKTTLCLALLLSLAACGSGNAPAVTPPASPRQEAESPEQPAPAEQPGIPAEPDPSAGQDSPKEQADPQTDSQVLVVYFSRVGNTDFPDDIDAVSSATLSRKDGELKGNAQLMAEWMADEAEGELFPLQTEALYPADYAKTTDVARQEQKDGVRPALKTEIDDFDRYTTVYLVFPNWWGDLPMAVYTFFDGHDCSGKTLYVSITHEGSGFSRTVETIRELEPDADVIEGLSLRGKAVADSEEVVRQFVQNNL